MNNSEIIGFYDYYYDQYDFSRIGNGSGKLYVDKPANDIQRFFYNDKTCPFCNTALKHVFIHYQHGSNGRGDVYLTGDIFECPICMWWTYKTHFVDEEDNTNYVNSIHTKTRYYAITKKFNISDKNLPLEVLSNELQKKNELLYKIDPYKLEELAQSILKDVYDCEVHHVGKTGDGGIDLIVLESDDPILVQVKRRQNPNHIELVKGIREFVGTLFIEGKRKGIYISTAKKYSHGSIDTAKKLLDTRKLDYFELIDYDKLCSIINSKQNIPVWQNLVSSLYSNPDILIYDTEEKIQKYDKL